MAEDGRMEAPLKSYVTFIVLFCITLFNWLRKIWLGRRETPASYPLELIKSGLGVGGATKGFSNPRKSIAGRKELSCKI